MGLSSKQVSGEGFDWAKNIMQAGSLELPNIVTPIRQQQQQQQQSAPPLKCPRCESSNTKFCYYNNYNRSQPRHFCKSCRRHWTKGGTLRNVPVGGGRKNKRLKTSSNNSSSTNTTNKDNNTSHGSKITKAAIQSQEQVQQQQLPLESNDQKKFSEILYQSLLQPTSSLLPASHHSDYINNNLLVSTLPLDSLLPLPNLPCTTFSSFNTNASSMLSSFNAHFQFPNVLNYTDEGNKPSGDLTTITTTTTTTATTITPPVQWQVPVTSNGAMDSSSNYWNWEDLNAFN